MTTFEFVSVLLSIVISLAFTHLLTGAARIIQAHKVKFSLIHAGWVGILLFSCVDYWFSIWQLRAAPVWTLGFVIFLLLLATALYLTSWLIMPEHPPDEEYDLVAFNEANRRKYLASFIAYMALGTITNLDISHFQSAILISGSIGLLAALAWLWRDRRLQYAVLAAIYALLVYYSLRYIPEL